MKWFFVVVKNNYANFKGRARREEYWMFVLFWWVFLIALMIIIGIGSSLIFGIDSENVVINFLSAGLLYALLLFIPSLAVLVRRLHDVGQSGWMVLLKLVPYLGSMVLFIFSCLDSQPGDIKYGPNPKGINLIAPPKLPPSYDS